MKPTFTLRSVETQTDYLIFVEAPAASASPGPWPSVLFLDGDDQFSAAVAAYRQLRESAAVPPLLLVGIGYGASYAKPANKRGRDYTPTFHTDEPSSGGGERFLAFAENSLWPELSRRYAVHATRRGVAGHSLGSLLVLFALCQQPLFFTDFLASAPSVWWDHRSILRLLAERHARDPVTPAHLFLSVGENDTESMTGDFALLQDQLIEKPFRELRVTSRRFTDRDHYTVLPDAFQVGLKTLFGENLST